MPQSPRVLFVSKPIVPPWHDGSKNLVRDISTHLIRARPTVLTTEGVDPSLGGRVSTDAIYRSSGRFAPGLVANARVAARLVTGDPHDLWHFVFAPNHASSSAARWAKLARRAMGWRGRVVQTVASAPRSFARVAGLLFGDVVVAQSEWTRGQLLAGGADPGRLRVIAPCATAPAPPSEERIRRVRARHELGEGRIVLYPGDYEVSHGAATFATSVERLAAQLPDVTFVFACRAKTPRAADAREDVGRVFRDRGLATRVRHVGEVDDMPALLAVSNVVAFPVDDLYGKVDVPLVLLEALSLGVPLVLARGGPLEALVAARFVDPGDGDGLARAVYELLDRENEARDLAERGKALYLARFAPPVAAAHYDDLYEELFTLSP